MRRSILLLSLAVVACGGHPRTSAIASLEGDVTRGETVYEDRCQRCHGSDLKGTLAGADLVAVLGGSDDALLTVVLEGAGSMPTFDAELTDRQAADLLAFMKTFAP